MIYLTVDVTTGLLYPRKPYDSHPERLTSPAYANEPYFSEEFLTESFTQPGGWDTPENTRLVFPREFHGKYFNVDSVSPVRAAYRRTINPYAREHADIAVLILGGSTVYNSEVPDGLTVASRLSFMLNSRDRTRYYVINAGVTSINSLQERERLDYELKRGLRPNIVVVYDGVNDIYQGVYSNNPDGVMFSAASRPAAKDPELQATTWQRSRAWAQPLLHSHIYSRLQERALRNPPRVIPVHMLNAEAVASAARRTKEEYLKHIVAMQRLAGEHGASLYVFLQPTAFLGGYFDSHDDARLAFETALVQTPKLDDAFRAGYPLLQEAIAEARRRGVKAYDLSGVFESKTDNIFLDFCHVNSVGNHMIADAMARIIGAGGKM